MALKILSPNNRQKVNNREPRITTVPNVQRNLQSLPAVAAVSAIV
jgi:hypothetical protein